MPVRTTIYKQQVYLRVKNKPIIMMDIRRDASGRVTSIGILRVGRRYVSYSGKQLGRFLPVLTLKEIK